jgi:hypothetical protein
MEYMDLIVISSNVKERQAGRGTKMMIKQMKGTRK